MVRTSRTSLLAIPLAFAVSTSRGADADGDGLLDEWEVHGLVRQGFEEPLPACGADPFEKDVFVEIDWMETSDGDPRVGALLAYQAAADVVRVFRRSGTGIRIHFDLGPEIESLLAPEAIEPDAAFSEFSVAPDERKVLPYQDAFPARPGPGAASSSLSLYDAYYGGYWFRPSRRNVFYYVVFAERRGALDALADPENLGTRAGSDGFADELASRDGLLDAGVRASVIYRQPVPELSPEGRRYLYSASLLHELGHAFGFGHGGSLPGYGWDDANYKPNYPSVMNYRFQFCGVDFAGGVPVMDFSHGLLIPLAERGLFEPDGLGTVRSARVIHCIGFTQVPSAEYPHNVDWNRDGHLDLDPVVADIDLDGRIDSEAHRDHDDWGKLVREGFDGIGAAAFRGRRRGADPADEIVVLPGDYDGDGRTDLFLLAGDRLTFAFARAGGTLVAEEEGVRSGSLGGWKIGPANAFLVGDFFGTGRDMVFAHREGELAVLEADAGYPGIRWREENGVPAASLGGSASWATQPGDRFLAAGLGGRGASDVVVANRGDVGILCAAGDEVLGLRLAWYRRDWGFADALGRAFAPRAGGWDGNARERVLLQAGGMLFGLAGPPNDPVATRLDRAGWIPWDVEKAGPDAGGWEVSPSDALFHVDLDGDGATETVLHRSRALGVLAWTEGVPRLVWMARDTVGDLWPLSERDRLYPGDFVPGGGKELLLSNGYSWLTLGWKAETRSLRVLGLNNGYVSEFSPGWELQVGQALFVGKFLPLDADAVCVQDGSGLSIARFHGDRFIPVLRVEPRVGEWILDPADRLFAADFDDDPEIEFLARRGRVWGVLDFTPAPRCAFLGRLDPDRLVFDPEPVFRRGDGNSDDAVDISDVVTILSGLFLGASLPLCEDAADVDDGGALDISDAIFLLKFLFDRGRLPAAPGPYRPGIDPTLDDLSCERPRR